MRRFLNLQPSCQSTHQGEEHRVGTRATGAVRVRQPKLRNVLHVGRGLAVHAAREHAAGGGGGQKTEDTAFAQAPQQHSSTAGKHTTSSNEGGVTRGSAFVVDHRLAQRMGGGDTAHRHTRARAVCL